MIAATVIGNLGRDAELKQLQSGTVLSFNVASNEKIGGQYRTTWVRCSLFGKRGEALAQYLTKGARVAVAGTMSLREYESKKGAETSLELRVNELELLGGKGENGGSPKGSGGSGGSSGIGETESAPGEYDDSTDIPF